ncbi:CBS domain-containing protein [Legionella tunisiensis]|uniref:CBS domain-containing protein n=1 Tax=Legionella tunisiensis TaxID=1034944 RepID=UPI0018DB0845|nr:CBS domain-containing protein [Legionella tunisiensis]
MRDNSVYCLPNNTIFDVAKLMGKLRLAVMPIVANEGLLGIITLRDIVLNLQKSEVTESMVAGKLMSRDFYCCYENDDIRFVAEKMGNLQIANLIVLNNEQNKAPTGIISLANLARHTLFLEKFIASGKIKRSPKPI